MTAVEVAVVVLSAAAVWLVAVLGAAWAVFGRTVHLLKKENADLRRELEERGNRQETTAKPQKPEKPRQEKRPNRGQSRREKT